MNKIHAIMADEEYINRMNTIKVGEKTREFCCHGFDHLLSVARLAYILTLEENIKLDKENIYAAALLHDIGRCSEYDAEGIDHRRSSSIIARPILERVGFDESSVNEICEAISLHGTYPEDKTSFAGVLYRADKMSRNCFDCEAHQICNWPPEKKIEKIDL